MDTTPKGRLALFRYFITAYPKESFWVVLCLILAGLAETLGIGALLPLITLIVEGQETPDTLLADSIFKLYEFLGVAPILPNLLMTIVVAISVKAAIVFLAMRYVSYVATDVTRDFRLRLIKALMKARWNYFTGLSVGKISNTISSEAARAGHSYMLAGRTLAAFIQSLIYVAIAFMVSWKVSLVAIVMGIFMAFLLKGFIGMARKAGTAMTEHTNVMLAGLNESLMGIKPLKAMGQEKHYIDNLDHNTRQVMQAQKKQALSSLSMQIIYEPIAVALLACGLFYVLSYTQIGVESVLLLAFLFYRLMTHTNLLQNFYQNMVQNEAAVWGMQKEIAAAEGVEEILSSGQDSPNFNDKISFQDVSIYYDQDNPIFQNFSAEIPKNKITALYGPSGIGKTTLVDCLLKLVKMNDGAITFDGTPSENIDTKALRQKVGYVPQETFLFHDSIHNNVILENTDFTEDDVKNALHQAGASDFVQELAEGIHTVVGERGGKLSGGQRQRIALARALIRNPALLILDESTSGLDAQTEDTILKTLKDISQNRMIIIISHNPKILDIADHIINLENQGTKNIERKKNAAN